MTDFRLECSDSFLNKESYSVRKTHVSSYFVYICVSIFIDLSGLNVSIKPFDSFQKKALLGLPVAESLTVFAALFLLNLSCYSTASL